MCYKCNSFRVKYAYYLIICNDIFFYKLPDLIFLFFEVYFLFLFFPLFTSCV